VWQSGASDLVPLYLVNMELSSAEALVQKVGNDCY
jgi:hypothetical protein